MSLSGRRQTTGESYCHALEKGLVIKSVEIEGGIRLATTLQKQPLLVGKLKGLFSPILSIELTGQGSVAWIFDFRYSI